MRWDGHRDAEPAIAAELHKYKAAGVIVAAKALGRSTRTINRIAAEHGFTFDTITARTMEQRRIERAALVPMIAELAGVHSQRVICERLGISRPLLRELAEENWIDINSRAA